ncbi:MAG: hypothetical protein ACLQPD_23585 [Desulfomonilaceae bacterium]
MRLINPKLIELNPFWLNVFPVDSEVLAKVEENMKTFGYDLNKPVETGIWAGQVAPVCLDGYVRVMAARNAGLDLISMSLQNWFSGDFGEQLLGGEGAWALSWSFRLRSEGRIISDGQLIKVLQAMCEAARRCRSEAKKKIPGLRYSAPLLKAINLASICHVSPDRAEDAIYVFQHGDRKMIQAIEDGKLSIQEVLKERSEMP